MHIAGVDGCREGWLCVEECEGRVTGRIFRAFTDLLAALPGASVIAVDIPISLPEQGKRDCDTAARRALSPTRTSSVFPTPVLGVLLIRNRFSGARAPARLPVRVRTQTG